MMARAVTERGADPSLRVSERLANEERATDAFARTAETADITA
jgi:hypothetical protein